MSRFEGFAVELEEASLDLGATPWQTFWRVVFPLVLPGIVASILLTFTISFDEFLVAFFLSSNEPTLPVYIWGQLRFPKKLPSALALGTFIIVISFVFVAFAEWLRRRHEAKGGTP
jgi:spermidine/putrescine transport system permease protein